MQRTSNRIHRINVTLFMSKITVKYRPIFIIIYIHIFEDICNHIVRLPDIVFRKSLINAAELLLLSL